MTHSPRVLMLCPQFRPIVGGYERAAERLAGGLASKGCAVAVITERRDQAWPLREQYAGFEIFRLRCAYRRGLHMASSLGSHALWLLRHGRRFDVWHVHQYGVHATLAILLGKLLRRPVVFKLTSSAAQSISQELGAIRLPRLQAWAHRNADACVAVSSETAEEARSFGIPAGRILRIGNGVDTAAFRPPAAAERASLRHKLGLPLDHRIAIYVGRLAAEKNPLRLLEAWAIAHPRFARPWTLVLVGDGPERAAVEARLAALRLAGSVLLAGRSDAVEDWLRAADLYVLSSDHEGLSNTTLEAMACGLPSVVTDVSGMRDLVRSTDAGRLVPVGSPAAFAEALVEMDREPAVMEEMGRRAREVILERYAIDAVARQHAELYARLVEQHHA